MMLSVIIPALNAADRLEVTIASLRDLGPVGEIVVVDGGSTDGTTELAARLGAKVIAAPRGRGTQLAAGGRAARHPWLLFLHADTRLEAGWGRDVAAFMAGTDSRSRAAAFRFVLDDPSSAARRLEAMVAWRCRRLGLPYGDQGLLIHRELYDSVGGYSALPLMEDVDLARRIGRERIVMLDAAAITSAARYRRDGYIARSLRNLFCLSLYFAGVPPHRIARLYG